MPSRVTNNVAPITRLLNKTPDYSFLRAFGCACWPSLRKYNHHKLQFRSTLCVFLGYSSLHKGYKCLDRTSGRIYISRDVRYWREDPYGITFIYIDTRGYKIGRFSSSASPQPNEKGTSENGKENTSDESLGKSEGSDDMTMKDMIGLVTEKEELLKTKQKEIKNLDAMTKDM